MPVEKPDSIADEMVTLESEDTAFAIARYRARPTGNLSPQFSVGAWEVRIYKQASRSVIDSVAREKMRLILEQCRAGHPSISIDNGVIGGMPRIQDTRIGVSYILDQISAYGSVKSVVAAFAPYLTEDQVKDALEYARDFLETASAEAKGNGR